MTDLFTLEHDYVRRADFYYRGGPGSLVQTPDGRIWTVVYHNLDGFGVVEGDRPEFIGKDGGDLVPPTHLLRDFYKRQPIDGERVEFLGDVIRVLRTIKDGEEVIRHPVNPDEPGSVEEDASSPTAPVGG